MDLLNDDGRALKPSETLAIKARAAALKAQGRSIIDLSAGEPDIETPEHIRAAAVKALAEGKTRYTAVPGIDELREEIAAKLKRENGLSFDKKQVIVTNGGKQALFNAFAVMLRPGDEVIILAPYWVSYPPMVELAGGRAVIVKTDPKLGFKVDPQTLQRAINERTRAIVINSPSNPTGAAYTRAELKELGAVISSSEALVISDEIYEKITYGDFEFSSFASACPELAARTLTVNGFSKTFAMTGWRLGYAAGPAELIEAMNRYQSQSTSNVCTFAQYGALAALRGSLEFVDELKGDYQRRMNLALEVIAKTRGLRVDCFPQGAFYLFVRFEEMRDRLERAGLSGSARFCEMLLEKAGVAVVPGEAFGDDLAFRMSVSLSDETVAGGIERISAAVLNLN